MAVGLVTGQFANTASDGSDSTIATTFPGTPTANNLVVAHISYDCGGANPNLVTGITGAGGTWSKLTSLENTPHTQASEAWYAPNISGGSATVTATISTSFGARPFRRISVAEFFGVKLTSPLDGTPAAAIGTSAAFNSGNTTTTAVGDLLVGFGQYNGGSFSSGPTGFTLIIEGASKEASIYYGVGGSAGNENFDGTITPSSVSWLSIIAAFQAEPAAVPTLGGASGGGRRILRVSPLLEGQWGGW